MPSTWDSQACPPKLLFTPTEVMQVHTQEFKLLGVNPMFSLVGMPLGRRCNLSEPQSLPPEKWAQQCCPTMQCVEDPGRCPVGRPSTQGAAVHTVSNSHGH